MTPEGRVKLAIANILSRSHTFFNTRVFFWYNASTGIFDPRTKSFRRNNSPHAIKGVSDILGLLQDGTFIAIEVKSEKGKLSPHQKVFLDQINLMGGIGIVANSAQDFLTKFKEALLKRSKRANTTLND